MYRLRTKDNLSLKALRTGIMRNFPRCCGETKTKETVDILKTLKDKAEKIKTQNRDLLKKLPAITGS
jgi:hypothetical protein